MITPHHHRQEVGLCYKILRAHTQWSTSSSQVPPPKVSITAWNSVTPWGPSVPTHESMGGGHFPLNTSRQSACRDTVYFDSLLWRFWSLVTWSFCFWVCDKVVHITRNSAAEQSSLLLFHMVKNNGEWFEESVGSGFMYCMALKVWENHCAISKLSRHGPWRGVKKPGITCKYVL